MEINESSKDQLKEIVSIGAGNASTALSKLLNRQIAVNVPEVFLQQLENIPASIGNKEQIVTAILLQVTGDITPLILLIFPKESSTNILQILTGKSADEIRLQGELEKSAMQEVGNILAGTELTSLSKFLGVSLIETVPEVVVDMLGSILVSVFAELGSSTDQLLVFQSKFMVKDEEIKGQLLFISNSNSTKKILKITSDKITETKT